MTMLSPINFNVVGRVRQVLEVLDPLKLIVRRNVKVSLQRRFRPSENIVTRLINFQGGPQRLHT